jgi:hypothetical protein
MSATRGRLQERLGPGSHSVANFHFVPYGPRVTPHRRVPAKPNYQTTFDRGFEVRHQTQTRQILQLRVGFSARVNTMETFLLFCGFETDGVRP